MYSPVVINLLWPETDSEEAEDDLAAADRVDTPADGSSGGEDSDDATEVATTERRLRRTMLLGSGLPTAGSLLARLGSDGEPQTKDVPPGPGYTIEVFNVVDRTFALVSALCSQNIREG